MPRPDLSSTPEYYHRYINQVEGNNLMDAMKKQTPSFIRFLNNIPPAKRNYRYAKGKWTIKEVVQHIMDTERVFAYRGLCFARKDKTPLPSFDENLYGDNAKATKRDWATMMAEFKAVRSSSELLFGSFNKAQLDTKGIASNNPFSVLAIGFILVGHVNHHIKVIKERYLTP